MGFLNRTSIVIGSLLVTGLLFISLSPATGAKRGFQSSSRLTTLCNDVRVVDKNNPPSSHRFYGYGVTITSFTVDASGNALILGSNGSTQGFFPAGSWTSVACASTETMGK